MLHYLGYKVERVYHTEVWMREEDRVAAATLDGRIGEGSIWSACSGSAR
jgi:hypothetical protein